MTSTNKAALIMVDMTKEQVASLDPSRTKLIVDTIQQLAAASNPGFALKIDSRLWLASQEESTLSWVYPEWGVTMGVPNSPGAALLPELAATLDLPSWEFCPKKHYSSFVDCPLLEEKLRAANISHVYLVGINTDYCIFNTAMDSFARGRFRTYVVEEGVGSISGTGGHREGLQWIRAHMGPRAVVTLEEALAAVSSNEE